MTGVKSYIRICRNYYLSAEDGESRDNRDNRASIPGPRTQARISQGSPVIATQHAKEKPDVRKESVSLAGPGLILVRLRGTKHASANLRLPIANAKGSSLSSGADRLHARMIAASIVAALESIHSLEHFLSILSCSHPLSRRIAATRRRQRFPRSPRHTTVPVGLLLAYLRTHTRTRPPHIHTYAHIRHLRTRTYTRT